MYVCTVVPRLTPANPRALPSSDQGLALDSELDVFQKWGIPPPVLIRPPGTFGLPMVFSCDKP